MADAVTTKVNHNNGQKYYSITITNISDGTGENGVVKIDKSALVGMNGAEPSSLVVERISASVQGFTSVKLIRDRSTPDVVAVLGTGFSYFNWKGEGGNVDEGTGNTGDLQVITNNGAAGTSGDTYTIKIDCRLKD